MAKDKDPLNYVWLDRELLKSCAFRQLTKSSMLVLFLFHGKKRTSRPNSRRPWTVANNGELQFTYREAERTGIPRSSFMRAIDQLTHLGFLFVSKQGSGLKGDCSLYGVSGEWRKYGTQRFKPKPRKKRGEQFRLPKRGGRGIRHVPKSRPPHGSL